MTIKRIPWQSSITSVENGKLATHGVDQEEIIRRFSIEESIFFLLRKRRPSQGEAALLRTIIVSHLSHGITGQSTLAVMEAADCGSSFLSALIGGFSVGSGVYHQGGLQAAMLLLEETVHLDDAGLEDYVDQALAKKERLIGFGHRFHQSDPRAELICNLARELGVGGSHLACAIRIETLLRERKGIRMNIEAAGGAVLLDMGFLSSTSHLFIILGRSPMFAAAYEERLRFRPKPFPKIEVSDIVED